MKQLVFEEIGLRLKLFTDFVRFSFHEETVDWSNNWSNIISTVFYTISQILFINILFNRTKLIAGYSIDQMLLFMLIGQCGYYLNWLIHANLEDLIDRVKTGNLDGILLRPVPSLFYVTFIKVHLFSVIRDSVPPILVICLAINWQRLHLDPQLVFLGALIAILGTVVAHIFHFLAAMPVFWLGESDSIMAFSWDVEYTIGKVIPLEGFNNFFSFVLTTLLPIGISAGLATSVMLGKSPAEISLLVALVVAGAGLFVQQLVWKRGLMAYTSASS